MVEHLNQNAGSIGKRRGTRQARGPRKTTRKVGMGGRSAVAQSATGNQAPGDHHLELHRHNHQQQCRHQQHACDVTRRSNRLRATIVQKRAHEKADHARTNDDALVNDNLIRRYKLGDAHIKEVLDSQKRKNEKRQAQNLPYAPAQVCGCVSQVPHGNPQPVRCPENHFNGERVLIHTQCPKCFQSSPNRPQQKCPR